MKKSIALLLAVLVMFGLCLSLTACGEEDLSTLREVSWEGKELTIKLGENQSSGCKWKTDPQDDKVIDYSINRKFTLQDFAKEAVGTLSAGFEGKSAGTTTIVCTTPCGWDGTGEGYTYTVTVTVNEDGTIASAEGK